MDEKTWLAVSALTHSKGAQLSRGQESVQASHVPSPKLAHPWLQESDLFPTAGSVPKLLNQQRAQTVLIAWI